MRLAINILGYELISVDLTREPVEVEEVEEEPQGISAGSAVHMEQPMGFSKGPRWAPEDDGGEKY